jgi:hypothetical protein
VTYPKQEEIDAAAQKKGAQSERDEETDSDDMDR